MTGQIRTIDLTPTWEGILPLMLAVVRDGNVDGYDAVTVELKRMAQLADLYVASQKREPEPEPEPENRIWHCQEEGDDSIAVGPWNGAGDVHILVDTPEQQQFAVCLSKDDARAFAARILWLCEQE